MAHGSWHRRSARISFSNVYYVIVKARGDRGRTTIIEAINVIIILGSTAIHPLRNADGWTTEAAAAAGAAWARRQEAGAPRRDPGKPFSSSSAARRDPSHVDHYAEGLLRVNPKEVMMSEDLVSFFTPLLPRTLDSKQWVIKLFVWRARPLGHHACGGSAAMSVSLHFAADLRLHFTFTIIAKLPQVLTMQPTMAEPKAEVQGGRGTSPRLPASVHGLATVRHLEAVRGYQRSRPSSRPPPGTN